MMKINIYAMTEYISSGIVKGRPTEIQSICKIDCVMSV